MISRIIKEAFGIFFDFFRFLAARQVDAKNPVAAVRHGVWGMGLAYANVLNLSVLSSSVKPQPS